MVPGGVTIVFYTEYLVNIYSLPQLQCFDVRLPDKSTIRGYRWRSSAMNIQTHLRMLGRQKVS